MSAINMTWHGRLCLNYNLSFQTLLGIIAIGQQCMVGPYNQSSQCIISIKKSLGGKAGIRSYAQADYMQAYILIITIADGEICYLC